MPIRVDGRFIAIVANVAACILIWDAATEIASRELVADMRTRSWPGTSMKLSDCGEIPSGIIFS
jgi:hypothetical protein